MKRLLCWATFILAACGGPTVAFAQVRLSTLPRITSTSGLADSSLFLCNDSTNTGTRACTFFSMRKRLQIKKWDSLEVKRLAPDTVFGAPKWLSSQTFATGQLVDSSTGAFRSQKLTTARTIFGQSFDGTGNVTGALSGATTGAFSNTLTVSAGGATITGNSTITGTLGGVSNAVLTGQLTAPGGVVSPSFGTSTNADVTMIRNSGTAATFNAAGVIFPGIVTHGAIPSLSVSNTNLGDGTTVLVSTHHSDEAALTQTLLTSKTSSVSSGTTIGHLLTLNQTVASSGTTFGTRSYAFATHTSGTLVQMTGLDGGIVVSGSGGTVTSSTSVGASATVESGATVTTLTMLKVGAPAIFGTVTTLNGLLINDMTAGSANFAIKTGLGRVTFGDVVNLTPITAPATNVSGGFFYVDVADNKLKYRGSAGTVTTIANPE